jgi:hypothetical protein
VHVHVLDTAVRLERGSQAGVIDLEDEEVLVPVRPAEQLIAHGTTHDVGVEPESSDELADDGRHRPIVTAID